VTGYNVRLFFRTSVSDTRQSVVWFIIIIIIIIIIVVVVVDPVPMYSTNCLYLPPDSLLCISFLFHFALQFHGLLGYPFYLHDLSITSCRYPSVIDHKFSTCFGILTNYLCSQGPLLP
jgi:hypothetical protein